jgi:hypothetical protein
VLELCPRCDGEGTIEVPGYSLNPYSGVRVIDPQEERTETCPDCRGEGVTRA